MKDIEIRVNETVEKAVARKITVAEAVRRLLDEIGRGGRILVIDENLYNLGYWLRTMNYTVDVVLSGTPDEDIKKELTGRVLITINGKDFVDDTKKYRYGLIWIRKGMDAKVLAERIKAVLMTANFRRNLSQVVKI